MPTQTSLTQGNVFPGIGKEGYVHVENDQVIVAVTVDDYLGVFRAHDRNDKIGENAYFLSGRAMLIDNGTKVLVLDTGGTLGSMVQVRIIDQRTQTHAGNVFGRVVWLPREFITR